MSFRIFAAAIAVAVLTGCGREAAPAREAERAVPVQVRRPARVERPDVVSASGSVEPADSVEVAFQLPGRISRVLVDEGQAVRKGQLLAELDAADYRNALNAAAAQAEAARAVARKAEAGLRPQEREQARIDYERWKDEYARMRLLYERRSLPPNDFRKIEAGFNAARERHQMAQQGARAEDRSAAEAQARAAEAQAAEARKRMNDTRLLAPMAGFVAGRRMEPGQSVAAGMPVISLVDLDPVEVRVGVPEAEIGKIRKGAKAEVTVPSLGGQRFPGTVALVGVVAEPTTRTYAVRIRVPNRGRTLLAGMVAEARVFAPTTVRALTLPAEAVVRDPQGATVVYVHFPDRRRVYARRIEVAGPLGSEIEIRSGLRGDEQVVVAGQQKVREGTLVEVVGGGR